MGNNSSCDDESLFNNSSVKKVKTDQKIPQVLNSQEQQMIHLVPKV